MQPGFHRLLGPKALLFGRVSVRTETAQGVVVLLVPKTPALLFPKALSSEPRAPIHVPRLHGAVEVEYSRLTTPKSTLAGGIERNRQLCEGVFEEVVEKWLVTIGEGVAARIRRAPFFVKQAVSQRLIRMQTWMDDHDSTVEKTASTFDRGKFFIAEEFM